MTPTMQVITEYCSMYVDDIRLEELEHTDAPLYARKMWLYLLNAIPLFNKPPEMQEYLLGTANNPKLIQPKYDSTEHIVEQKYTEPFTVALGADFAEYEIFNARARKEDALGNVTFVPVAAEYDATSGEMTINATEDAPVEAGTEIEFDFYTDGYFAHDLSPEMMKILGMCFQVVWTDRFNTDWLSNVTKIEDKSFLEQNRANKMRADTERMEMLRNKLAGEMRGFAQNRAYLNTVPFERRNNF